MTAVPLVDLTPWYAGGPADRRQVATDVDRALCELGVLLVAGHPLAAPLTSCVREEARLTTFPGGRGWLPPSVDDDPARPGDRRGAPPRARRVGPRGLSTTVGAMMGMGNLGPDGRRRQRLVAGIIVAAMLLAAGAVLLGSVL